MYVWLKKDYTTKLSSHSWSIIFSLRQSSSGFWRGSAHFRCRRIPSWSLMKFRVHRHFVSVDIFMSVDISMSVDSVSVITWPETTQQPLRPTTFALLRSHGSPTWSLLLARGITNSLGPRRHCQILLHATSHCTAASIVQILLLEHGS